MLAVPASGIAWKSLNIHVTPFNCGSKYLEKNGGKAGRKKCPSWYLPLKKKKRQFSAILDEKITLQGSETHELLTRLWLMCIIF